MKFPNLFSKMQSILAKRKQKKQQPALGTQIGSTIKQNREDLTKELNK